MHTEAKSTELPSISVRRWADIPNHLLPLVAPADGTTALPDSLPPGTNYNRVPFVAHRDYAALLFVKFDTSTHGDGNATATPLPQGLEAALEDLRCALAEAEEEGYPQPSQLALSHAKRIVRRMHALFPTRLEVYPTQDGEVAIVAPGIPRRSVMVLCDSSGGALCMVNMDGVHRRARYSTADTLPDGFLRDALEELASRGG